MLYVCPWLSLEVGRADSLCRAMEEEREGSMWNILGCMRPKLVSALAVVIVGMMGGTAATVAVRDTEAFNQHVITATTLATDKLESLKALGFRRLSSMPNTGNEDYDTMADFPTFRRQTAIAVDTPDIGMQKVTVTVWWDGNANAVRLSLILAE